MISLYSLVDIPASSLKCEIISDLVLRKKNPICMVYPYLDLFETVSEYVRFVHFKSLMLISVKITNFDIISIYCFST